MAGGGSNWQVQLEAIIDSSKVSSQIKAIANEKIRLNADLDLTNFAKSKETMVNQIEAIGNQIKAILGKDVSEGIGEANINKFATEYVKSWQTATQQVQNEINKTLNSLNSFSTKNAGFENFSTQIGDTKVQVSELKQELEQMQVTNDITGLDNIKTQLETLKTSFTETAKGTDQVKQALQSIESFSLKNTGFDNFSTEIDGAKVSVEDLKTQLEGMKVSGDFSGLDNVKNQIETLKTSFTELEKNSQMVEKELQNLGNFSFQNAGFDKFSSEINGVEVSVQQLKTELESMKISGDISGLNNVKNEITMLEQQFTQLSQQADKAFQSLNSYSITNAGFDNFKVEIDGSIQSVEQLKNELSNMSINANFTGLDEITAKISQIKTEFEQVSQIQFNVETGSYEAQVENLVAKTQQWVDANGQAVTSTESLSAAMQELSAASEAYSNNASYENQQRLIQAQQQLQMEMAKTKSAISEMNAEYAKTSQVQSLLQRITEFVDKNSAAMRNFGSQLNSMMAELNSGVQMPVSRLKELETEFKQVGNAAREAGQLGQSFGDKIQSAMSKFSYWTSATMIVMQSINAIRTAITTVVDLDTALIDLQKTTSMTTDELEDFYYAANDTAKQMGVTTEEIIDQAAAWSRLGYSSQEAATTMAALSSQFASISPGMDTETAQEGLVSVMKAFEIDVDDVLDGVMSKINIVGNTAATTNADIIEMLERSSSAMVEANNTLDETIALETAA